MEKEPQILDNWLRCTLKVAILYSGGGNLQEKEVNRLFWRLGKLGVESWDDRRVAETIVPYLAEKFLERNGHSADLHGVPNYELGLIKALRLGYLVAAKRLSEIPRAEREFVRSAFGIKRMNSPAEPDAVEDALAVRLPWRPTKKSGLPTDWRASTLVQLQVRRVKESAAPVEFRLRVTDTEEWLDVRVVDGQTFRPVLAPGGWKPATLNEACAATASGEAWGDNPFINCKGGATRNYVRLGVAETTALTEPGNEPDAKALATATEAAQATAYNDLAVIGDGLWRRTGPVLIDFVERHDGNRLGGALTSRLTPIWTMDGLSQMDRLETLIPWPGTPWTPSLCREWGVDPAPLGAFADLLEFARVNNDQARRRFEEDDEDICPVDGVAPSHEESIPALTGILRAMVGTESGLPENHPDVITEFLSSPEEWAETFANIARDTFAMRAGDNSDQAMTKAYAAAHVLSNAISTNGIDQQDAYSLGKFE